MIYLVKVGLQSCQVGEKITPIYKYAVARQYRFATEKNAGLTSSFGMDWDIFIIQVCCIQGRPVRIKVSPPSRKRICNLNLKAVEGLGII